MIRTEGPLAPLFAVCYDVSSDRERRRIDKLLSGFGFRVQKSVFECHLTPGAHRHLRERLDALGLQTGHVRLYRVYGPASGSLVIGVATETPDQNYAFTL